MCGRVRRNCFGVILDCAVVILLASISAGTSNKAIWHPRIELDCFRAVLNGAVVIAPHILYIASVVKSTEIFWIEQDYLAVILNCGNHPRCYRQSLGQNKLGWSLDRALLPVYSLQWLGQ